MQDEQGLKEIIKKMYIYIDDFSNNIINIDELLENVCSLSDHYEFSEDSLYDEELVLKEIIQKSCDVIGLTNGEINGGIPIDQRKNELVDEINDYLNTDYTIINEINQERDELNDSILINPDPEEDN